MSPTTTAKVIETGDGQAVHLPEEIRFEAPTISVRQEDEAVVLEPIWPSQWPEGFIEAIHIDDPAFARPPQ